MNDSSKKPAAKVQMYPVSAAIWRNTGKTGVFYSATFERSYKDESGKYQSSDSFPPADLLLLAKVADAAHTEILKLRANDREAKPEDETD